MYTFPSDWLDGFKSTMTEMGKRSGYQFLRACRSKTSFGPSVENRTFRPTKETVCVPASHGQVGKDQSSSPTEVVTGVYLHRATCRSFQHILPSGVLPSQTLARIEPHTGIASLRTRRSGVQCIELRSLSVISFALLAQFLRIMSVTPEMVKK